MWVYWVLFWWPAISSFHTVRTSTSEFRFTGYMKVLAVLLVLTIGLRFEVGMDWGNYLTQLDVAKELDFVEVIELGDAGYGLINWIAGKLGVGIWLVNLASASIFCFGLMYFCKNLPNPWLGITVAIPYMAIVMAMNYTRQGAAFGFVLLALTSLRAGKIRHFVGYLVAATLFHKTAALIIPIAFILGTNKNQIKNFLIVAASFILAYSVFVAEHENTFYETYILDQYESDGAVVRVAINSVAAIIFLLTRKMISMSPTDLILWTRFSLVSLLFIPAVLLSPSTTVVDRMALYFMPIQLVAFTYFPYTLSRWGLKQLGIFSVVSVYWLVMFVWFNYSNYYHAWLPYRFYPFEI